MSAVLPVPAVGIIQMLVSELARRLGILVILPTIAKECITL